MLFWALVICSFVSVGRQSSIAWMYHIWFLHYLLMDIWVISSSLEAIMNEVSVNTRASGSSGNSHIVGLEVTLLLTKPWNDYTPNHQLTCDVPDSWPLEMWHNKFCCLKLLCLGLICYVAIDNQHIRIVKTCSPILWLCLFIFLRVSFEEQRLFIELSDLLGFFL